MVPLSDTSATNRISDPGPGDPPVAAEVDGSRSRPGVIDRRVLNPMIKVMVRLGLTFGAYALIETTGRVSGRVRTTPVGRGRDGDVVWIVAEHGEASDYVRNLIAEPRVRIRFALRWRSGTATLLTDDDGLARRKRIDASNGLAGRLDGRAFRAKASEPTTIRIDLDPTGARRVAGAAEDPAAVGR